jgi:sarcosine oxidase subunit gamma
MQAAGAALDLNICAIACRSAHRPSLAALGLGPDEQLLLEWPGAANPEQPVTAVSSAAGGPTARRVVTGAIARGLVAPLLTTALAGLPHSLVDVSHRQVAIEVSGAQSELILNVGCPLDLQIARFPVGMCTRTLLGKAQIMLWRTGDDSFHVEVWRSFADYTSRFLAEAARESTC